MPVMTFPSAQPPASKQSRLQAIEQPMAVGTRLAAFLTAFCWVRWFFCKTPVTKQIVF
jgi:hypothetical protein